MSTVKIGSAAQWRQIVNSSSVVVADFYADWCGPCKMIAPTFESLSTKYSKPNRITFCKVDVDNQGEVAQQYSVRAMPTFLILHNGSVIQTVQGANPPALTSAVEAAVKLAGSGGGATFSSPGHRLGGSGPAPRAAGGNSVSRPLNFNLNGLIGAIITFFGLYFTSLFSLDPPARQFTVSARSYEKQETSSTQKNQDNAPEADAEHPETIVRQARQTFGQTLPPGYLSEEEYGLYVRLYGPPLRETRPEDVGIPHRGESGDVIDSTPKHSLFREIEGGELEEVEYSLENSAVFQGPVEGDDITQDNEDAAGPLAELHVDYMNVTANNRREYAALMKLQRDFEAASLAAPEEAEEEIIEEHPEEEDIDEDLPETEPDAVFDKWVPQQRTHPNTILGQWGPNPSTVHLPKAHFVEPITQLLGRTDITHIKSAAEKLFGGPGLPLSPATPDFRGPAPPQRGLPLQATQPRMSDIDADVYISTVLPPLYATVLSTLVEVRKRLGADWIRGLLERADGKGPRVLDIGGGGAGLAAWQEVLDAEWDLLHENDAEARARGPPGKKTVIVGSDHLRHRISRFLHNTTFLPRLPDYLHSVEGSERQLDSDNNPAPRKRFDVIIASHILLPKDKDYARKAILDNLWAMLEPNGGVLIVLEKGHPRGFEAVASVRMRLLDEFIIAPKSGEVQEEIETPATHVRDREPGMIIAPCTNHTKCPLYLTPGLSPGRKDFCHFDQRFIRPPFLQRILGSTHRNHEDVKFSYVAVRRGAQPDGLGSSSQQSSAVYLQGKEATDRAFAGYGNTDAAAPNPLSLPRNVKPPLKGHGHITMEVCTPAGAIERWVVPKSFSKQAYRDARKAQWGDLWALGAKTRTHRNPRLGRIDDGVIKDPNDGGVRSQRAAEAGKRKRDKVVQLNVDPMVGLLSAREKYPRGKGPTPRRTKGGRRVMIEDLLKEAGIDQLEEEDPEERELR
ncbi:putative 37s ribosomal protein rsm22 protein [Echria macrotheca]|uniref:37s ribosomal protein rsm22 protein n=1 Tax=Echria macrotheca TaxID=438768 RepID=A0AAJ0BIQ7_9PEZI|nr:putative 37s ribosomal protein rsm22 protein [Echria macrotheca]